MATFERFEDIDAWKKARMLVNTIYEITAAGEFARDYGLKGQAGTTRCRVRSF
jgi:hypothetical protein